MLQDYYHMENPGRPLAVSRRDKGSLEGVKSWEVVIPVVKSKGKARSMHEDSFATQRGKLFNSIPL